MNNANFFYDNLIYENTDIPAPVIIYNTCAVMRGKIETHLHFKLTETQNIFQKSKYRTKF